MANTKLKFRKLAAAPTSGMTAGEVIFCTGDHTIYVATSDTAKQAFYGGNVKNVTSTDGKLIFSFMDGTKNLEVDFSDMNSTLATLTNSVSDLQGRVDILVGNQLVEGKDIHFTTGEEATVDNPQNAINVSLDKDITVMGVTVGNLTNGSKLLKGKSLSEILQQILMKTIDAKVGAYPSVTLTATGISNGQRVEVGANVTATLSYTYTDGKFVGAESAYSYNQVAGCTKGAVKYYCNGSEITSPHKPSLTEDAFQYKCTAAYSASTNTPKKNDGTNSAVKIAAGTATSNIITIYARYPIYTNGVTSSISDTTAPTVTATADSTKLPLVDNGTQFGVAFAAMTTSTGYRLLLHDGKKITSAKALNGLTGKYDIDVTSKFVKGSSVSKAVGTGSSTYNVWEYKATEGANRVIFTIGNE